MSSVATAAMVAGAKILVLVEILEFLVAGDSAVVVGIVVASKESPIR